MFPRPKRLRDSFPPPAPPRWQIMVSAAVLPTLLDPHAAITPGFGRGPGPMHRPHGANRGARPPAPPAPPEHEPGVTDLIHQPGAAEFLAAVRDTVPLGDVIFVRSPPAAGLITGVTGRWTSNGMLPGVQPAGDPARPQDCEFFARIEPSAHGPAPPPGGPMPPRPKPKPLPPGPLAWLDALPLLDFGPDAVPSEFVKVFENEFGSLWRNPQRPAHNRKPVRPTLPSWLLLVLLIPVLALPALDYLPALGAGGQRAACVTLLVAATSLPLSLACRSVERTMLLGNGGEWHSHRTARLTPEVQHGRRVNQHGEEPSISRGTVFGRLK